MSTEAAVYLDSSALVKLVIREQESGALRTYLGGRGTLLSSALARTEVIRAVLPLGPVAVRRAQQLLTRIELIEITERILIAAGMLQPASLRSLDAIHIATAHELGEDLSGLVSYDQRMVTAAATLRCSVDSPA